MKIAVSYALFAVLATVANIGSQDVSLLLYDGTYSLISSVLVGTLVGLLVKYTLDKRYIFNYQVESLRHETKTFYLYSLVGAATTVIFWGFEFGFDHVFDSKEMRYLGAGVGLCIGYSIKYQLDKRFVFT